MTEPRSTDSFEARLGSRLVSYTDPAVVRRIDPLHVSRAALGARSQRQAWRLSGRWAAAVAASLLIVAAGVAILGRPAGSGIGTPPTPSTSPTPSPDVSAGGPVPVALLHPWQRPYSVTPDMDPLGGVEIISLASGILELVPTPGAAGSRSTIVATSDDTLEVRATDATTGCAAGDSGAYRWSLQGSGTVMTLTAIGADGCAAREALLAGQWVRSEVGGVVQPLNGGPTCLSCVPGLITLRPGTYSTSDFDPFGTPGVFGQLSYTVPDGWKVKEDLESAFVLHRLPGSNEDAARTDMLMVLLARPRMSADFRENFQDVCFMFPAEMPGVGHGVDDLVSAIQARPGVLATPPEPVTIGGFEGQMLDVRLDPSWSNGCTMPPGLEANGAPMEGQHVEAPILLATQADSRSGGGGPGGVGLAPDAPLRLVLLDLGKGQTIAIAVQTPDPSRASQFDDDIISVMPVIESFEFHPPSP